MMVFGHISVSPKKISWNEILDLCSAFAVDNQLKLDGVSRCLTTDLLGKLSFLEKETVTIGK